MRWMHLRFEAPLASFGTDIIDAHGFIGDFPAQSMIAGLFANALGWDRSQKAEHQELQDRLVFGAIHDSDPASARTTDYQTARLGARDKAWSTRGHPIGRTGGPATYEGAHQRWRDYHTDLRMSLAARLLPSDSGPTMDLVGKALERPRRPLFIGRRPCLPTSAVFRGWIEAADLREALRGLAPKDRRCAAMWPQEEGTRGSDVTTSVTDERNWKSGLHGGARLVCRGRLRGTGEYR